jgi:hypothetical protein
MLAGAVIVSVGILANVSAAKAQQTPTAAAADNFATQQTAGFTGDGLCFEYFGAPSGKEAAMGFPPHGEAASQRWNAHPQADVKSTGCRWDVWLPNAQLLFERTIRLRNLEAVVYAEEIANNEKDADHACHWVQHATFSPPFLNTVDSSFAVSGARGVTAPEEYEGGSRNGVRHDTASPGTRGNIPQGKVIRYACMVCHSHAREKGSAVPAFLHLRFPATSIQSRMSKPSTTALFFMERRQAPLFRFLLMDAKSFLLKENSSQCSELISPINAGESGATSRFNGESANESDSQRANLDWC